MIYTILIQGLLYSLLALGCYITFNLLKYPDLTVEGSFVLGATVGAILINMGVNPIIACFIAIISGSIAGLITGLLNVYGKINDLLASIITTTALYTVNMVLMNHRANVSIARKTTIFNSVELFDLNIQKVIISLLIVALVFLVLRWFLSSRLGMFLRATGNNSSFVTSMGGNFNLCKIIGLSIANALAALSGCLIMQNQLFVDIGMTSGIVVLGFSVSILGITFASKTHLISPLIWIIIAGIVYQGIIGLALQINFHPNYLKAIMAAILAVILIADRRQCYD